MNKLIAYAMIASVVMGGVFYISTLRDKVADLESQVEIRDLQIEIHVKNMKLLSKQLVFETKTKEIGDDAVLELKQEVSQPDFNTQIPESVQDVLDKFHSRIRP